MVSGLRTGIKEQVSCAGSVLTRSAFVFVECPNLIRAAEAAYSRILYSENLLWFSNEPYM